LSRVLTWTANDGSASNNTNAPAFTTVVITAVNDAPTLSNVAALRHFVIGHTLTIAPAASVSDPDNLTLANATVKVTAGAFAGDGDVFAANVAGTSITSSYNAATETLVLSGSDTLAHYQQVLDSVTFTSGANPTNSGANTTRTLNWVLNDGAGSFNLATTTTTITISAGVQNDFDGNLVSDLLFQNVGFLNANGSQGDPTAGTPQIWLVNNTSVISQTMLSDPGNTWSIAGTGDFNGDTDADLLFRNTATGDVRIWEMNGTSVVVDTTVIAGVPAAWSIAGVGDFNGDGTSDILWRNTSTGEVDTWFINNGHYAGGTGLGNVPSVWQIVGTGDFNGDGKSDILWRNTSTGEVDTWFINNGLFAGGTAVAFVPSVWQIAGTGDFDGNGTSDILFRNTSTGEVDNWLIQNGHFSGGAALGFVGSNTRVVGTGDYDGDSKADILLQNTDGTPTIWTMNSTTVTSITTLADPGQTWHAIAR